MKTGGYDDPLVSTVYGPASRAMIRADFAWVSGWLTGRFGVEVSAEWVSANVPTHYRSGLPMLDMGYSDGSWAAWFKRRLADDGMFPHADSPLEVGRLEVTLHVGFLCLDESPEHWATLRRPDGTRVRSGPDTPGIERREAPLGPIDRTAARVLPTPPRGGDQ